MTAERQCSFDLAREAGLPVDRFPITKEETRRAEDALADELNRLSLDEQEKIIFDVHGISTGIVEDEETVAAAIEELEAELFKISKKEAYNQALFLNKNYVTDKKFRLLFLRTLEFDAAKAASMIVDHFEVKKELFGDGDVLAREVRQSDLNARDTEILEMGISQILPTRDASGRAIIAINCDIAVDPLEMSRAVFYQGMAYLRDEEMQKGAVWVVYNMHHAWVDLPTFAAVNRIDAAVPCIGLGGHYCFASEELRPLVAGFRLFFNRYDRHRMRAHFGNLDDVHFKLLTFGIPVDSSPMLPDGSWSTEYHMQWLRAQRLQEEENVSKESDGAGDFVIIPRKFDVLMGKCSRARMSTGTQRALHLVDMHRDSYEKANKFGKTHLAQNIIAAVHEANGRFLKQDEKKGGWVEVDDLAARQKVAHWFRHMRSKTARSVVDENSGESSRSSGRTRDDDSISTTGDSLARPMKRAAPIVSPPTLPEEVETSSMSSPLEVDDIIVSMTTSDNPVPEEGLSTPIQV